MGIDDRRDNMKKILVLLIFIGCLFGCGKKEAIEYDFASLEPKLQTLLPEASVTSLEMLSNKYDVDITYIEEGLFFLPTLPSNADMVLLVKAKEGRQKEVKNSLDALFELFEMQYELYYPEEYEKISNKTYKEKNRYFFYIVSNQTDKILETIEKSH